MHKFTLDKPDNLVDWWGECVTKFSDRPLFGTKNKEGVYEWATYKEIGNRIDNVRAGLTQLGIGKDDVVGIIANNRPEWAVIGFASWGCLARYVPMYEAELVQVWKYIIADSGAKVLFVARPELYEKIKDFQKDIPTLKHIFIIDSDGENSLAALEKKGAEKPVAPKSPKADDVAELIYTSGTTGNPKGVLLMHMNFTSNSHAGLKMYPELYENEVVSLTILPWAHVFGQTAELFAIMRLGGRMGLIESTKTIINDIVQVKPTFIIAVPTVFNRIYDGLWNKMNKDGGLARALFVMGVEAAKKKGSSGKKTNPI